MVLVHQQSLCKFLPPGYYIHVLAVSSQVYEVYCLHKQTGMQGLQQLYGEPSHVNSAHKIHEQQTFPNPVFVRHWWLFLTNSLSYVHQPESHGQLIAGEVSHPNNSEVTTAGTHRALVSEHVLPRLFLFAPFQQNFRNLDHCDPTMYTSVTTEGAFCWSLDQFIPGPTVSACCSSLAGRFKNQEK